MSDNIQKDQYNQTSCKASSKTNCVKKHTANVLLKDLLETGCRKENYKNKEVSLEYMGNRKRKETSNCGSSNPNKNDLKKKKYTCDKTSLSEVDVDKRNHSGKKTFQCEICDKGFTASRSLKRHKQLHTSGNNFQCVVCDKMFTQSSSLIVHMRTHTGEKPFSVMFVINALQTPVI